jgi:hypothetical protein
MRALSGADEDAVVAHGAQGGSHMTLSGTKLIAAYDGEDQEMTASPRNRLMLAVLEEALVTFQRGLNSPKAEERRQFHEVDRWVASGDTDWPFSFENVCGCLKIDPDYVRKGLQCLKHDGLSTGKNEKSSRLRRERIYDRRGWRGQIK